MPNSNSNKSAQASPLKSQSASVNTTQTEAQKLKSTPVKFTQAELVANPARVREDRRAEKKIPKAFRSATYIKRQTGSSKTAKSPKAPTSVAAIRRAILAESKVLDLPPGSTKIFADLVAPAVVKKFQDRGIITDLDVDLAIADELEKYSKDLAYIFRTRERII